MITRFAPSPTGPLHLGHAYSALLAHDTARAQGGKCLLRIDDLDQERSKPHWEQQIHDDLNWLGLSFDGAPTYQSHRTRRYQGALEDLWRRGLVYPCTCTRRDIAQAHSAPQETVGTGQPPQPHVYPGTCRARHTGQHNAPIPEGSALRLDMDAALMHLGIGAPPKHPLTFWETGPRSNGEQAGGMRVSLSAQEYRETIGDIVLARKEMAASYHLAVCLDDYDSAITHVIRGDDLFEVTPIHTLVQALLELPTPIYHHHDLIRDENGKRLAKRDNARAIEQLRDQGASPRDIRLMVGL